MAVPIEEVLNVLRERGVDPAEQSEHTETPELPGIGEVEETETIYATSIDEVFREDGDVFNSDDGRLGHWWREVADIIVTQQGISDLRDIRREPPEPHCAWYCPIHFFGHGWGNYIREECILSTAADIARAVSSDRLIS